MIKPQIVDIPEGHILFIDGPIQVSVGPASVEELNRALTNINKYLTVAFPQMAARWEKEQKREPS